MAEIRVNSTGGVKLYDADDSHYAQIKAGTVTSNTDVLELGSGAVVAGTKVDLNGQELILDADADTSITADTDDQIDVRIAGADDFQFTANTFTAQSGSSIVVPDGGLTFGSTAITSTAAELNILDGVTSTAAELNIVDGNTSATSTTIADADRVVLNDNGTMVQAAVTDLKTYIGGGDFVQVASGGASSGDGTLTVAGCFTSSYKVYKIFLYNWNGSAGNAPYLRWLTGTNTEQSGANTYYYCGVGFNTSGQNSAWSGNDSQFQIFGESFVSDEDAAWEGTLYNPSGTSFKKKLVFAGGGVRSGPYNFNASGTGEWSATTAITGFKVWPSGGNFDSCEYEVYGLKS
jgi:hypothetical protein